MSAAEAGIGRAGGLGSQRRVRGPDASKLLVVRPEGPLATGRILDLGAFLSRGDVLVVNDAATWPSSFETALDRTRVEVRLAARRGTDTFRAVLFGDGDHHVPTERRGPPPEVTPGARLVARGLTFVVEAVDAASPRLVELRVESARPTAEALLLAGRPVQYAHMDDELALWDVQTLFASRPWSFEMPSATRLLSARGLAALRGRGVVVVPLTHGAGLTSTGDAALDARLPFDEPYDIPEATAEAVRAARAAGRRVVAAGTSVVRALEGSFAANGSVVAGGGTTSWLGAAGVPLHAVDAMLTGLHVPGESHFELLRAFLPQARLDAATALAAREGWVAHEFGDAMLVFRGPLLTF